MRNSAIFRFLFPDLIWNYSNVYEDHNNINLNTPIESLSKTTYPTINMIVDGRESISEFESSIVDGLNTQSMLLKHSQLNVLNTIFEIE